MNMTRWFRLWSITFLLMGIYCLMAVDITPGQLLFKTSRSVQLQRGKTGITAFDSYLNTLSVSSVQPVAGMKGNQWFAAQVNLMPDWDAIQNQTLRFDGIDIIQPNYLNQLHVVPNDPWYSLQQMDLVELPAAWNYTTGSPLVLVGVIDSGVLKDHPDLQANIFDNHAEIPDNGIDDDGNGYIDDYCGWDFADAPELSDIGLGDFTGQDNDVTDENFHGTHVAGIVGANANNGIGVSGVCWNVKILPIRAGFRTAQSGFLQDDDAAAALIYAADMGVSVINMSWGDAVYSPIIADACQYAYGKGIVLVASAGNDPGPYLSYPAKLACVISVGAVDPYKNLAGFSSYGPELALVAPGQNIYSTYKTTEPDLYKEQSGTSMSSPFVAGAVALLKSIQPNLTPDEVRARLLSATDDLGPIGYDVQYGHGLLNVRKLLENLNPPEITVSFPSDQIGVSEDFDFIGTLDSPDFFRYSVMYTTKSTPSMLDWYDVLEHTNEPNYFLHPVHNGVLAHFYMAPLLAEGEYLIRIQCENNLGEKYNYFKTVFVDRTPPDLKPNTFGIMKRYDGQNIKYYAGAMFTEPVRAELRVFSSGMAPVSCFATKMDSLQVWQLPITIPAGNIDVQLIATNNSNLTYTSPIFNDAANLVYEIIPQHGFTSREIGAAMVPMNDFYDYDNNGIPEFVTMNLPNSGYGNVSIKEPGAVGYNTKYDYGAAFWSLDLGNTNASGRELLALNLDTAYLYETRINHAYPDSVIWNTTGISGGTLADYSGDGVSDIMLVQSLPTERIIQCYKRIGAAEVSVKNKLHNTTPTNLRNMFVSTVICDTLDGDLYPDILTADTDGDIMIFEVYNASSEAMTWTHRMPVGDTYYLTAGDFDGDGNKEFMVGGYNKDQVDANQSYWFFEGFKSDGNDSYVSMGFIQFNNVMSQNSIQAFDVDNDAQDEIIMALSPNLYVLKYQNGKFNPIFYNNSMRTYQIAAWKQNGSTFFLTNQTLADTLKAVEWSSEAPFTGPATPANLIATPQNDHTAQLTWQSSTADMYRVYRRQPEGNAALIAEVLATSYTDSLLTPDQTYEYTIRAVDADFVPNESLPAMWRQVIPRSQPILTSITMIGANELRLIFDQPMSNSALNPGFFRLDHDLGHPLSVNSVLSQRGLQLRFRMPFPEIDSQFVLTLTNVYGITGVAPQYNQFTFGYNPDYIAPEILSVRVIDANRKVELTMSETIDSGIAALISNYELITTANDSDNSITAIEVADDVILLTFAHKLRYSNQPYYLVLHEIADLAGNAIPPHHNTARIILSNIKGLEDIIVFPNPVFAKTQREAIFLNFPPDKKGKLYIYTTSGELVYESKIGPFNPNNNNLTCRWELMNQNAKQVASGIYYYLIEMDGKKARGKIAVIN